ncbi:uncharacterized protein LOC121999798 [Zingiber officinale]|uniref:uncharacterized protein LOC121999798 n=1 Tax=Zingiber officinale TaxID=94328 RepID=UPI001C4AE77E|nr:uncharacterized protein LOC121999798 [Zingiber officinale]
MVVSTYCQKIKFPVDDQVGEVKSNQLAAQRCYVEIVKTEVKVARKTPRIEVNAVTEKPPTLIYEVKEEVQIHPNQAEATIFIATDLEEKKAELVACLKQNHDVFAWSTHELPDISLSVVEHKLHVRLDALPVKQRKRDFSAEHNVIIHAEIEKLLEGNGQVEVINREILRVLRARLDHMGGSWVDELPGVLWALRTTPKEAISVTPFQLVYDNEVVFPVEVRVESDQVQLYDERNAERRLIELDLVDEARAKLQFS